MYNFMHLCMNRDLQITLLGKRQAHFPYPWILPNSFPKSFHQITLVTRMCDRAHFPASSPNSLFCWVKNCISFWYYFNFSDPSIWALVFTDACWPIVFLPLRIFCLYPLPILSIKLMGLLKFFVFVLDFSQSFTCLFILFISFVFFFKND